MERKQIATWESPGGNRRSLAQDTDSEHHPDDRQPQLGRPEGQPSKAAITENKPQAKEVTITKPRKSPSG